MKMFDRIFEFKDKPWTEKKNAHPASVGAIVAWLDSRRGSRAERRAVEEARVGERLTDPRLAEGWLASLCTPVDEGGNQTRNVTGYRILRDENEEPLVIGERLIPQRRFFEAQEWLAGRGRGNRGGTPSKYLLTAMDGSTANVARPKTGSGDVYKCGAQAGVSEEGTHEGGEHDPTSGRRLLRCFPHHGRHHRRRRGRPAKTWISSLKRLSVLARRNESPEIRSERAALLGERSDIVRSIEQLYSDLRMGIYDGQIGRQQFLADKSSLETRLRAVDARIVVVGDSDLPSPSHRRVDRLRRWRPPRP
ncbi:hypothetical protein SANTM175S_03457 [Streptomyces antimycoticus]